MSGHVAFHPHLIPHLKSIYDIRPHPDNPNEGDVDAIAESILINGMYKGVTVQKSTGYIIEGEHRYLALLQIGETMIPVYEDDVDDNAAKRIMLADNSIAARSERIPGRLHRVMTDVIEEQDSLAGTGYDRDEYASLSRMIRVMEHVPLVIREEPQAKAVTFTIVITGWLGPDEQVTPITVHELGECVQQLRGLGYAARGGTDLVP